MNYEPIKKEIYEKPGKKMGQENDWKARVKKPGAKFGDGSEFKKGAITRRLAKKAGAKQDEDGKKRNA